MAKYKIKFMFDWECHCLWAADDVTKEAFGYDISPKQLPISRNLRLFLYYLEAYHDTSMDMEQPPYEGPWWTEEDSVIFRKKCKIAYEQLCKELGEDYEVIDG